MTDQYFAVGDSIVSQIRSNCSDDELIEAIKFYDYVEIHH